MNLASAKKVAHGRCETPAHTIARLRDIIEARYEYRLLEEKVSDHLYWAAVFIDELEFRAMGKGHTGELALAGAYAEAAEWIAAQDVASLPGYATGHQVDIPNAVGYEELLGHISTITPAVLGEIKNLDIAQYWVNAHSLMDGATRKVPIEYLRMISGPNGHAAGNRVEEAIVHACNEVFERRAHITVLRNRLVMPTIDLATINHPVLQAQMAFIQGKGIEVVIKDLSFDGQLPCIGAYFFDPYIPPEYQFHHFFKVGASFDTETALSRIFTEYSQGRKLDEFLQDSRTEEQQRILGHDFRALKCMDEGDDNYLSAFMFGFVPFQDAAFLREGEVVAFTPHPPFADCLDDIAQAKNICASLEKDLLVVDFTDPEIDFPVVAVVVPGYSDVLPYHPAHSRVLYEKWTREEVLKAYDG